VQIVDKRHGHHRGGDKPQNDGKRQGDADAEAIDGLHPQHLAFGILGPAPAANNFPKPPRPQKNFVPRIGGSIDMHVEVGPRFGRDSTDKTRR